MRILVFLHGKAIMNATAVGQPRDVRVRQSWERDRAVADFAGYVPAEGATAASLAALPGRAVTCVVVPEFGGAGAPAR